MLPLVALQFTGMVVESPADVRATATSSVAPATGMVRDFGTICRRIDRFASVGASGFSQPTAARAAMSHASFNMASRRDSLCLNDIERSPQLDLSYRDRGALATPHKTTRPPGSTGVDPLAARRAWRRDRRNPVALRHRLSTGLL